MIEREMYYQSIRDNLNKVCERIESACKNSGRDVGSVKLLFAVKTVPADAIRAAVKAGISLIGENRVQEFAEKYDDLSDLNIERHFIGHLQTNKAKEALKYVSCIQTVDNTDLIRKLNKQLQKEGRSIDVMVQVNTSFEKSKYGLPPDAVFDFLKELRKFDTLKMQGFMTIGLFDPDPEKVRPSYSLLCKIRDKAISEELIPPDARQLSMGMSGDLEIAVHEGATIVRIGSAVSGNRM